MTYQEIFNELENIECQIQERKQDYKNVSYEVKAMINEELDELYKTKNELKKELESIND